MKKMLLTLFAAAFTLFPKLLFSQTITGPTEVCPNTTVRYSWSGCPLGGSLTVVQDPGPYTIVAQGPQFIDLKFDPYSGTLPFILRGSCSGQFPQKDIKVISGISFTPPATESENVPCPKRGEYNFYVYGVSKNINKEATVVTTTTGWVHTGTVFTTPTGTDPNTYEARITFDVTNSGTGEIRVTFKAACAALPDVEKVFNINRVAGAPEPAPAWQTVPGQFCAGQTTTAAVQAYAGASGYTWTSDQPSLLIDGQVSPVVTVSPTVTLSKTSGSTKALLSVTAQTVCGNTLAATSDVHVGFNGYEILGSESVCSGDIAYYTLNPVPPAGITLQWTTANGVITSGGATFKARIRWPVSGYGEAYVKMTKAGCTMRELSMSVDVGDCFAGDFSVSPNPAKNNISVELMVPATTAKKAANNYVINEVQILDKAGTVVKQQILPGQSKNENIDISRLRPDVYIIRVRSGKEWKSKQIIVK